MLFSSSDDLSNYLPLIKISVKIPDFPNCPSLERGREELRAGGEDCVCQSAAVPLPYTSVTTGVDRRTEMANPVAIFIQIKQGILSFSVIIDGMELEFRNGWKEGESSRLKFPDRGMNVATKLVLQANLPLWKNCPIAYLLRVVHSSERSQV